MSDGINGKIGEEGQVPLLVIADESDEATPALVVAEEAAPEASLPAPAVEAIVTQPEAKAPAPKSEAKAAVSAPAPAVQAVPAEAVAHAPEPVLQPTPASSAPLPQPPLAIEATAPATAAVAKPKHRILRYIPLAAVSMAVFASSLSVIGLLVASRTLAETKIVLEQVQRHQSKMRHLDTVIDEVDALRQREQIALVRIEQINAGKPATSAEMHSAINGLQLAMSKYQPDNLNSTLTNIRDGQYELAERISTVYRRVENIDEAMAKMGSSPSPKAKRGAGREPIS